jgi:hypothetical protein
MEKPMNEKQRLARAVLEASYQNYRAALAVANESRAVFDNVQRAVDAAKGKVAQCEADQTAYENQRAAEFDGTTPQHRSGLGAFRVVALARDELSFAEKALAFRQTSHAQAVADLKAVDAAVADRAQEVIDAEIEEVADRCLARLDENARDADILREYERNTPMHRQNIGLKAKMARAIQSIPVINDIYRPMGELLSSSPRGGSGDYFNIASRRAALIAAKAPPAAEDKAV